MLGAEMCRPRGARDPRHPGATTTTLRRLLRGRAVPLILLRGCILNPFELCHPDAPTRPCVYLPPPPLPPPSLDILIASLPSYRLKSIVYLDRETRGFSSLEVL